MASTRKRAPARTQTRRSTSNSRARGRGRSSGRGRGKPSRGLFGSGRPIGRGVPRLPVLDQRGRDVLGLALVALGVFMGFVLYGGWDGGRVGHGLAVALGWVLGKARVLAPLALIGAGGVLLLDQGLAARRALLGDPRAIGAACLFAAATLALAAGTLGVSSGAAHGDAAWTSAYLQSHGGVVGEGI
jgi:S-DNA-T family DNA segregation ATPase FtsK/SpoIIIE